jgi:N-methylhydantoinase A/oxoprolinase/acetone carboxylase beta subunit
MSVRIGIDVGGTFTDAVALDGESYELIGYVKVLTTHDAKEGIALGIIQALQEVIAEHNIKTSDVSFIAHGTTQATNALLEGDVDIVGIISLGHGIEGIKAKRDTNIGDIKLAKEKYLKTRFSFVKSNSESFEKDIDDAIRKVVGEGALTLVATEAFSVDDPKNENKIVERCLNQGLPATAGNDVSKLYGLKIRTRTAVVNASILPKMLDAANLTEQSIQDAHIEAPLMVMRCDGGVITVDEVRKRPILTILSGPAAGVAGALMYERLTDGIFLEVGGTSTDISCVRDGSVIIKYAEVGGHKTYLNSLDVRTVGIGGGSMVELQGDKAVDVGPRSAHIAGLDYEVYAESDAISNPVLIGICPHKGDPEYACVECANGKKYALTLSGAASIAGFVPAGDYAEGNVDAAKRAWQPLAEKMNLTVEQLAQQVLTFSAAKTSKVIRELMQDYALNINTMVLVGGGGGAATVVPHLAESIGCKFKIAKNAPVISPIGVCLAMVRELVERVVMHPSEEDMLSIRNEAMHMAIQSGASPETVEVQVTVDSSTNKLRAIAFGSTEMRSKEYNKPDKTTDELKSISAESLNVQVADVKIDAKTQDFHVISTEKIIKKLRVFKKKTHPVCLIDRSGVIRLQRSNATVYQCKGNDRKKMLQFVINEHTIHGDGGEEVPNIFVVRGKRIISLVGMQKPEQMHVICDVELAGMDDNEELIMLCALARENTRG